MSESFYDFLYCLPYAEQVRVLRETMNTDLRITNAEKAKAIGLILQERTRQDKKWGTDDNHEPEVWLAILIEEVGELAECILHKRFGGPEAKNLKTELVQVAAVAMKMLERGVA